MIQTLIIDDEAHIRDSLSKLISRHCPNVSVVGEADSVETGRKAILLNHPDLVLLDIQMIDGTGFDLLNSFQEIDFKIIFITAYDQFAIRAFRFSAVDYLLKPVDPELLIEAINRAGKLILSDQEIKIRALNDNIRNQNQQEKKIILKTVENIYLLSLKDIVACESDDNYTHVHTTGNEQILVSKTLKEHEEMLSGFGFSRVHKSFLINLSHIRRFEKQEGGYIILSNGMKIPVSSRKREEVLHILERMAEG